MQVCLVNVRVVACEKHLVLVDIANWVTASEFTPLQRVGKAHRPYSFSTAQSTNGSSSRQTIPSVLVGSISRSSSVVRSGLRWEWPCFGCFTDLSALGGGCEDIHRRTPAVILPRTSHQQLSSTGAAKRTEVAQRKSPPSAGAGSGRCPW